MRKYMTNTSGKVNILFSNLKSVIHYLNAIWCYGGAQVLLSWEVSRNPFENSIGKLWAAAEWPSYDLSLIFIKDKQGVSG